MLASEWAHLRAGSITRGGIHYGNALRKILLVDNFRNGPNEISGISKWLIQKNSTNKSVTTLPEARRIEPVNNLLISFEGSSAHEFDDLWESRETILEGLQTIAKQKWLPNAASYNKSFIAINVRLGNDFKKIPGKSDFTGTGGYLQTPLDWYVEALREVRKKTGSIIPAIIISDGTAEALKPLLDEPETSLGSSPSAIGDLLILAKGKLLLGAGRSSFSAWASFLGKMPTITIPGSSLQSFHVSKDLNTHYVGEWDARSNDIQLETAIKSIIHEY